MPKRKMTRQGYNTWLTHYIIPMWGKSTLQELQARPVDLWLQSLALAPKSKVHIRGLVRVLWDFAMWRGDVVQRSSYQRRFIDRREPAIANSNCGTRPAPTYRIVEFFDCVQIVAINRQNHVSNFDPYLIRRPSQ